MGNATSKEPVRPKHFIHLSRKPVQKIQNAKSLGGSFKPQHCIWLSCGNAWEEYTSHETPNALAKYKYKCRVDVDMSQILCLRTWDDVLSFHREYAKDEMRVNWERVRKKSGKMGIYVKHVFKLRAIQENILWLTTFDVCSVAIWNSEAVLKFTCQHI